MNNNGANLGFEQKMWQAASIDKEKKIPLHPWSGKMVLKMEYS